MNNYEDNQKHYTIRTQGPEGPPVAYASEESSTHGLINSDYGRIERGYFWHRRLIEASYVQQGVPLVSSHWVGFPTTKNVTEIDVFHDSCTRSTSGRSRCRPLALLICRCRRPSVRRRISLRFGRWPPHLAGCWPLAAGTLLHMTRHGCSDGDNRRKGRQMRTRIYSVLYCSYIIDGVKRINDYIKLKYVCIVFH